MPNTCTIHCVNHTNYRLSYVETSPQDPQRDIVVPNATGTITVKDHASGRIRVIVCQDPVANNLIKCSNNDNNSHEYTIENSDGSAGFGVDSKKGVAGDFFQASVTNKMPHDYNCVLIYKDNYSTTLVAGNSGPVPATIDLDNPSDVDVKMILCPIVVGFVEFTWNGRDPISRTVTATPRTGALAGTIQLTLTE